MLDRSRTTTREGPGRAGAAFRRGLDALLLAAIAVAAAWLATNVDLAEMLASLARQHPDWPLDAVLAGAAAVPLTIAVRSVRRASRAQAELARRERDCHRLEDFYASSDQWLWEMDADQNWCGVSESAPQVLHRLVERHAPMPPDPQLIDDDALAHFRAEVARGRPFRGLRFGIREADGRIRHLQISGRPASGADGEQVGYRGAGRDITEAVAQATRAERASDLDPLTSLPNRASLRRHLDQVVTRVRNGGDPAILLCLDVDRFNEINDSLGEPTGDRLVQLMAERMRGALDEAAWLARIGPDQLAIVRCGSDRAEDADELCRRLLNVCSQPFEVDGHLAEITIGAGMVTIGADCDAADEVLEHVDIALHQAKATGRGQACLYEPGMDAIVRRSRSVEQRLRRAMAEGEFELHYQPQISVREGRVVGFEALLRWRHPERGLLFPKEFLADTESSGLIVPLGAWVLRTACAEAAGWQSATVSVNLSMSQFQHPDLIQTVDHALQESGLKADRLMLEIPETALLRDSVVTSTTLEGLARLGVRVAIDDFGTGYALLGHLQSFDKIKIDRALIVALERRAGGEAVVGSLIELGRSLGVQIAAEGIETPEQRALLQELGCLELQGYYFGRPLESDEVTLLLDGIESSLRRRLDAPAADAPAA